MQYKVHSEGFPGLKNNNLGVDDKIRRVNRFGDNLWHSGEVTLPGATMRRMKLRRLVPVLVFGVVLMARVPGEVENDVAGKPPVALKLKDGETRFSAGDFAHIAKDLAPTPFRNVTVEFLKDEDAKKTPPPKWDEERGLQVLEGGTKEILFVKDGVRVSDIQLQPGGVVPKHHHAGPHLVVAVTDLELRSEVEGKGSTKVQQKTGDIAWVAGGSTHALTNTGKQAARFIILEFQ